MSWRTDKRYRGGVRGLIVAVALGACHLPDTNPLPDANQSVRFQLGLTTRYLDPAMALSGLSVWVDGENRQVQDRAVVEQDFQDMDLAAASAHTIEVRYGARLLDRVVQHPGDTCSSERGDNNRLLSETVDLCVRSNGEIALNDFSCEYERTGFYTADVFCPTDCHPLLGGQACPGERCGLVLTNYWPRYGVLACAAEGLLQAGASCRTPALGQPDACAAGLACVAGACRSFCVTEADCDGIEVCESALSNEAEPLVCLDPLGAPRADLGQL